MPRPRSGTYESGYSIEPLIIDRNPRIIDRSPEDIPLHRGNSESRRPRSSTRFVLPSLFPRRGENTVVVRRTSKRRSRRAEHPISSSASTANRGRQSSPPPPPVIVQERSRSTPPVVRFAGMSPTPGSTKDFVPLPPKKTKEERQGDGEGKGRKSRSPDEQLPIIEDPRSRSHRYGSSDPLGEQEQVLSPSSPRYEVTVMPNETVRSRPTRGDVRDSKEYVRMRERADWYKKEAEAAAQRHAYAEVQLQNSQNKLAEMQLQISKSNQREDDLRHELDKAHNDVQKLLQQNTDFRRERELSRHQARIAEDQLEGERRQKYERERDRERKDRSYGDDTDRSEGESGSRNRRHRRPRIVTIKHAGDSTPRTPDPEASTSTSRPSIDPGTDAINRARAQHHGRV